MATEKRPGKRESKVFEKCSADQKCVAPSPALTMVKEGLVYARVFLRVTDEKTSETEGKRESEDMGRWWQ